MPKKEQEPTNQEILVTVQEILGAVNNFATYVEGRFNGVDERFAGIDQRFDGIDQRFDGVDQRFDRLEERMDRFDSRLDKVGANMVTKDYLDDKLADLRSDFGMLFRKEDKKVNTFIRVVHRKKVITSQEAGSLLATGPFSKSN